MAITRRAIPHFKVGDPGGDLFYIYADDWTGDATALSHSNMTFHLRPGTTLEQAEELKNLMGDLIESVTEGD